MGAADPVFQPMRAGTGGVRHVDMVAGTCQVDGDGRQAQPPAHGPLGWARGAASGDIVQRETAAGSRFWERVEVLLVAIRESSTTNTNRISSV